MGKRVILYLMALSILSMTFYLFISNRYNLENVEVVSEKIVSSDALEALNFIEHYQVIYEGEIQGHTLNMLVGDIGQLKKISLKEGNMIMPSDGKGVVVGDGYAEKNFKKPTLVGELLWLNDKPYIICGVEKHSDQIYINYDAELLEQNLGNWKSMHVYATFKNQKNSAGKTEQIQKRVSGYIAPVYTVNYKEAVSILWNLSLLSGIMLIVYLMKQFYRKTLKFKRLIQNCYNEEIRGKSHSRWVKDHFKLISEFMLSIAVWFILLLIAFKGVQNIIVPESFKPSNVLSLRSYEWILRDNLELLMHWLKKGVPEIVIEVWGSLGVLILVAMILKRDLKRYKSTC